MYHECLHSWQFLIITTVTLENVLALGHFVIEADIDHAKFDIQECLCTILFWLTTKSFVHDDSVCIYAEVDVYFNNCRNVGLFGDSCVNLRAQTNSSRTFEL